MQINFVILLAKTTWHRPGIFQWTKYVITNMLALLKYLPSF